MSHRDNLQKIREDLAKKRQELSAATGRSEIRKQNEIAQEIATLRAKEEALIPLAEQEAQAAAEWEASQNTPQARQEKKRIEELRREVDREALKLYEQTGQTMAAALQLFQKVETLQDLISRHTKDKVTSIHNNENVQAAGYLLNQFRWIRQSMVGRPDLQKYFPKG